MEDIVKSIEVIKSPDSKLYALHFLYDNKGEDGDIVEEGSLAYITSIYYKLDGDNWRETNYVTACKMVDEARS